MAEVAFATSSGRIALRVAELAHAEATLLDAVRHVGLPLGQSCRGEGVCRSCAVDLLAGGEHLGPPTALERRFGFHDARRLACQARLPPADATAAVFVGHPAWGRLPAQTAPEPEDPGGSPETPAPTPAADATLNP